LTTNWATTTGSAATPWKASIQGNDTGLDHQPRAAPSRLNPCIQGFEVGVNCAAAAVIMALAGKTSTQGRHVRCRNAGTLAAPWQQQPALAGA
jgi:hypothetical protein